MDDIWISVVFTLIFIVLWFGFRATQFTEAIDGEGWTRAFSLIPRSPNGWILFIFTVLITSNAYHVFYGENTISNYFEEEPPTGTMIDVFSSDIECQQGHSAQLSYETTTYVSPDGEQVWKETKYGWDGEYGDCDDSFLGSYWLDTYEFTVAMTFFVSAFAVALLDRRPSRNESTRLISSTPARLIAGFGFIYGFFFPIFADVYDQQSWRILDGVVLTILFIYTTLLAVSMEGWVDEK